MAFDLDNEELKATRKDKGLDDGLYEDKINKTANEIAKNVGIDFSEAKATIMQFHMSNKTSDKNVENIETTNNKNKYIYIKEMAEKIVNEYREKYKGEEFCPEPSEQTCMAYEILHLLSEREQDKKRIQEIDKVIEYCKRFEYETEPIQDDDYLTERALVCGDILELLEGEK